MIAHSRKGESNGILWKDKKVRIIAKKFDLGH